jgi:hypothetical protein
LLISLSLQFLGLTFKLGIAPRAVKLFKRRADPGRRKLDRSPAMPMEKFSILGEQTSVDGTSIALDQVSQRKKKFPAPPSPRLLS